MSVPVGLGPSCGQLSMPDRASAALRECSFGPCNRAVAGSPFTSAIGGPLRMRVHDDNDLAGGAKRAANPARNDASSEIQAAIANPHQASVQTMLEVQRLAGNAGVSKLLQREDEAGAGRSPVLDVVGQGGGSPLSGGLKNEMEGRLGADFSDVKVHTDGKASDSAKAV